MNTGPAEFTRLAAQRTWDKDVVVWAGTEMALKTALPKVSGLDTCDMDILDLLNGDVPDTDDAVASLLRRGLRPKLKELQPKDGQRRILIVKSCGLLVRYNLGLKEFFDWFCSDRAMAVLLIEDTPKKLQLPSGIDCRPGLLLEYFHKPDLAKHLVTAN